MNRNIDKVLSLDNYLSSDCIEDAAKLKHITVTISKSCQLHPFLVMFGHSSSCSAPDCTTSCRMFRRTRYHIKKGTRTHAVTDTSPASPTHVCAVMHIYGQLLRMHVDTCVSDACGMHSCKDIRKMREEQGHKTLPANFKEKEIILRNSVATISDDESAD